MLFNVECRQKQASFTLNETLHRELVDILTIGRGQKEAQERFQIIHQ